MMHAATRYRAVAIAIASTGCGPSLVVDGTNGTHGADTGASSEDGASATADDGPGTSATTSTGTTANPTVATSVSDTATTDPTDDGDDCIDPECCIFGCNGDGGILNIECDVWAQDCPKGEKCMPWANDGGDAWNATKCIPIAPDPGAPGQECLVEGYAYSGIDDCDLGAMCWDVDPDTNAGTCVANCSGSEALPSCDDPATSCMIEYYGVVHVCLPACDPLLQDCVGQSCVPVDGTFVCVPDHSGKSGHPGTGCLGFDGCDPGNFCAPPEFVPNCADLGCCTEFCILGQPEPDTQCSAAADGAQCLPYFEEDRSLPERTFVGACVLPS